MNIIVSLTDRSSYCFRPDTTLEKESNEFYIPEDMGEMTFSPVLFVRICKAGKAIGKRFAERYYDAGGYGLLLYAEDLIRSGRPAGFSMASSLDRSTFLHYPLYGKDVLLNPENIFSLSVDDDSIFTFSPVDFDLDEIISCISANVSLRTGDIVAVELREREQVISGNMIRCRFNDDSIVSVRLI